MGRRAATSAEALADSAMRVVERVGVAGATSRAIAAEAGVALGTVYRHVPDLEHLLRAAAERVQATFVADLQVAAPAGAPLRPAVPRVARALVARARAEPRLAELLALPVRQGTATAGVDIRAWIADRVRRAVEAGEVAPVEPRLVAAAAYGLVRGTLEHALATETWDGVATMLAVGLTGTLAADPPVDTGAT